MKVKTIYIAEDGTEFEGNCAQDRCRAYERTKAEERFTVLSAYIKFFDWQGKPLSYSMVCQDKYRNYVGYANVLEIPNEDTESEILNLWDKVVPCELDDEITSYGCGWYISDDNGCFRAWVEIVQSYQEQATMIEKIIRGD